MRTFTTYIFGLLFSSCAYYSFSGGGLPAHIRTVSVPPLEPGEAQVVVPGLEEELTEAMVDALISETPLQVVGGGADALLEGRVVSVREDPFTYTSDERAQQWRLRVVVRVRFEDLIKRRVLWEDEIGIWGVYGEGEEREKAVEEVKEMLAEEIVRRILGGW